MKETTEEECWQALCSMSDNKSPGSDGFSKEFHKEFWPILKFELLDCLNTAYELGELSTSQKQAAITLLEKQGKDPLLIDNWRPVSPLNVDYKIAIKAILTRIKQYLSQLVHTDQTGFVPGRYIGETLTNRRLIVY